MVLSDVNNEAKWLQRHSFGADYTIIQLPTDAQHAKDGCVKKTGNVIFLA